MGLNLDLCQMLNAPRTVACPKCGKNAPSDFDDYDVECGKPNPAPGVWNLHCYCDECDHEWEYSVTFNPDLERELGAQVDALRRELVCHREKARENYWAWQGDGEDHIESLVCPVLIHAEDLRQILKHNALTPPGGSAAKCD